MLPQIHFLSSPSIPSIFPSQPFKSISKSTHFNSHIKIKTPSPKSSKFYLRCSLSVAQAVPKEQLLQQQQAKPSPAEVSRTIMELSSVGTLSMLADDGWPIGVGVQFLVDAQGGPVLCLNAASRQFSTDRRSSLHVQKLNALWAKRYGEEVDEDLIYVVSVERVLQMEDFREDGVWVASSEYVKANPDPLRNCAEKIVNEMNAKHKEDVHRFCNIYADLEFKVMEAKMIWVDRLGFDVHVHSQKGLYEVRIPFPREVTDEKGVKSSFNCMSQLAWEVEKNYTVPEFEKVKHLKEITCVRH
ncbi:glutamyl-tRNA reductase-binding protein, chloroplastic-like [Magnolia sinica]|uniref:glutamyl-tRNA reductase-binding protein, chloroplastic-like n=1 Tax=Magnolia sinica TaxID=86752 RepID=UPI00265AAEE6|nr:glutamyl-tRNA reductase-binding protein, chloroplastic-like [Magnolia sinica]